MENRILKKKQYGEHFFLFLEFFLNIFHFHVITWYRFAYFLFFCSRTFDEMRSIDRIFQRISLHFISEKDLLCAFKSNIRFRPQFHDSTGKKRNRKKTTRNLWQKKTANNEDLVSMAHTSHIPWNMSRTNCTNTLRIGIEEKRIYAYIPYISSSLLIQYSNALFFISRFILLINHFCSKIMLNEAHFMQRLSLQLNVTNLRILDRSDD